MADETILVVGGAGYIGSHMVADLLHVGYEVVTLDDLSRGHREMLTGGSFIEGNLACLIGFLSSTGSPPSCILPPFRS